MFADAPFNVEKTISGVFSHKPSSTLKGGFADRDDFKLIMRGVVRVPGPHGIDFSHFACGRAGSVHLS